jgi:hypothetical protein
VKKTYIASCIASLGLALSATAYAQVPAKMVPLAAEVAVVTATVESVDLKNRTIVVKDANGNMMQMNVSKQINNLDKVKKGDAFVIENAQAIAIGLTGLEKGMKPGVSGVHSVTIAGKGSKPFEESTDTVYATVKIGTIDYKTRVVTFTLPSGEKQTVKVAPSVLGLEKFKTGDDVMVEFVDDTAIGFVPAKK